VVTLNGRDFYLGAHGTRTSKAEYDRLVGEWMTQGRVFETDDSPTVTEVCVAYWRHAKTYYRKDGKGTSEVDNIRDAVRLLLRLYGRTKAAEFTPLALKALRQRMIRDGLSRKVINSRVNRIRRVFRWAVSEDLVSPQILQGLQAVEGLRYGRSEARETKPVGPVPRKSVEAVLPRVSRQVAAMIQLQLLTGMRPGEVVQMRAADIDRSGEIWTYRPSRHKTQHFGIVRQVPLGPQAQKVLEEFMTGDVDAALFRPCDAEKERLAKKRLARKTPVQPSQRSRAKLDPTRKAGRQYTTASYYRAILRAAELAKIESWSPNQLRHTFLTEVEREFGLDAARACAGHTTPDTTTIYVKRDQTVAAQVMGKVG